MPLEWRARGPPVCRGQRLAEAGVDPRAVESGRSRKVYMAAIDPMRLKGRMCAVQQMVSIGSESDSRLNLLGGSLRHGEAEHELRLAGADVRQGAGIQSGSALPISFRMDLFALALRHEVGPAEPSQKDAR
jgi:hypothetical protein